MVLEPAKAFQYLHSRSNSELQLVVYPGGKRASSSKAVKTALLGIVKSKCTVHHDKSLRAGRVKRCRRRRAVWRGLKIIRHRQPTNVNCAGMLPQGIRCPQLIAFGPLDPDIKAVNIFMHFNAPEL